MANVKVGLVIYAKLKDGKGWQRFSPVKGKNGRYRPGYGMVKGIDGKRCPKQFETFTYQLRTVEGKRIEYKSVGTDLSDALDQQADLEKERRARHVTAEAGLELKEGQEERKKIKTAAQRYISSLTQEDKIEAAHSYGYSLEQFQQSAKDIVYVDQINRDVILRFHDYLKKCGNGRRTVSNRHGHIKSFLLWCGLSSQEVAKMIGKPPKYDEKLVVAYHADELSTLFANAEESDRYYWGVLNLLLMAGVRDREGTHLTWPEVDFKRGHIKLAAKPGCRDCVECRKNDRGFRLKDREERIIPIHPDLMTILRERRKAVPHSRFVFGDANDKPHTKWLRMLKRTAREAGLNCGHCDGCRDYAQKPTEDGGCKHWTLHSFRRTYATKLLKQGANVKMIMQLLGHSDLETTMRYLAAAEAEENAEVVARIDWFKK
jgi:integrase